MKSMKGRFLKKLNFIPSIGTLKQGPVSHLNSTEKFPTEYLQIPLVYIKDDRKRNEQPEAAGAGKTDVSRHLTEVNDEELELEHDLTNQPEKDNKDYHTSLSDFEEKCPQGGNELVVLYTTSLRSIRKTFEDCHAVRFLLESFKVKFEERDVSMHLEFREELWRILGSRVIPPRLFIQGRYIGGAYEVVNLHEQGKLKKLLEGMPRSLSDCPCTGCGSMRFVVCLNCNGSRRVFADGETDEGYIRCPDCNENGLVKCPICSRNLGYLSGPVS